MNELVKIKELMEQLQASIESGEFECKRKEDAPIWVITYRDHWPPDNHYEAKAEVTVRALLDFEMDKLVEQITNRLIEDFHKVKS